MAETLNIVAAKPLLTDDNTKRTRNGRWTLAQLRQTDGIVPLQSGTNKFDSQKGKTAFGTPRNTQTSIVFADDGKKYTIDQMKNDTLIRLQSGTNKFESQKGMTGFGAPRDVKGKHLKRIWELEFPEESPEHQFEQMRQIQMEQAKQPLMSPHHNGSFQNFNQYNQAQRSGQNQNNYPQDSQNHQPQRYGQPPTFGQFPTQQQNRGYPNQNRQ